MRLYHRTPHAKKILAEGFKDNTACYMTDREFTGVWFSNYPLDINENAKGDTVLMIEIPARMIKPFERIEEGKPYREFLIPAELANKHGPPVVLNTWNLCDCDDRVKSEKFGNLALNEWKVTHERGDVFQVRGRFTVDTKSEDFINHPRSSLSTSQG